MNIDKKIVQYLSESITRFTDRDKWIAAAKKAGLIISGITNNERAWLPIKGSKPKLVGSCDGKTGTIEVKLDEDQQEADLRRKSQPPVGVGLKKKGKSRAELSGEAIKSILSTMQDILDGELTPEDLENRVSDIYDWNKNDAGVNSDISEKLNKIKKLASLACKVK